MDLEPSTPATESDPAEASGPVAELLAQPFTAEQARAIAALFEKSHTTPQYYPMTANALMNACNQKNSRNPRMSLSEGETGAALIALEQRGFARRENSGRAVRWEQRFGQNLRVRPETIAVLVSSILRGPQTKAELRNNSAALGGPADDAAMNHAMQLLIETEKLMVELPRQTGQKESRFAHLVCGPIDIEALAAAAPASSSSNTAAAAKIDALESRVAELEARLAALEADLGR